VLTLQQEEKGGALQIALFLLYNASCNPSPSTKINACPWQKLVFLAYLQTCSGTANTLMS
jgi:hypothetical protein